MLQSLHVLKFQVGQIIVDKKVIDSNVWGALCSVRNF